jgi:hypothetical protein
MPRVHPLRSLLPHRARLRTGDAHCAVTDVNATQALTHTEPVSAGHLTCTGHLTCRGCSRQKGPAQPKRIALFA